MPPSLYRNRQKPSIAPGTPASRNRVHETPRPILPRAGQRGEDTHDDHRRDDVHQEQRRNHRQGRTGNRAREHEHDGREDAEVPYGPPSIVIFLISFASLSAKRPGLRPARLSTGSLSSTGSSFDSFEELTGRDLTPRPVSIVYRAPPLRRRVFLRTRTRPCRSRCPRNRS